MIVFLNTGMAMILISMIWYGIKFVTNKLKQKAIRRKEILQDLQSQYPGIFVKENWTFANSKHWTGLYGGMRHKETKDFVGYTPESILDDPSRCHFPNTWHDSLTCEQRKVLNDALLPIVEEIIIEHEQNVCSNNKQKFEQSYKKDMMS